METRIASRKDLVVLGAGYGGLRTALRLEELLRPLPDHRIVLLDQNSHHQLIIHLHEVAAGRTPAGAVALPLDQLLASRNIDFRQAVITGLDLEGGRVLTDAGEQPFHRLVIALGSETNFYNIPGMPEHAFTLKSLRDACLLQTHIRDMLAWASSQDDPQAREEPLTFVVGGGGFTGTELAAEMAESLPHLAQAYGLSPKEPQVVVLEASQSLLPGLHAPLAARAARSLREKGVRIIFGTPAEAADAHGVTLGSDQRLAARTIIWTGGVRAPEMLARSGLHTGPAGRVKVDPHLQVVGYPGVYVIGDSALVFAPQTQRPAAPSAQLALRQAEAAAWNIFAEITGQVARAYRPRMTGEAITLGRKDGVAWLGPLRLAGAPATWLKGFIAKRYLVELGGLALLRSYSALGSSTLGRDFPECVLEHRVPSLAEARR